MTDEELLQAFDEATLTPPRLNHREHVRITWLQVTRMPLLEAIRAHTCGLRRLTAALGVPGRYNETITIAYLLLVFERASRSGGTSWNDFARDNPDLLERGAEVLAQYYGQEVLYAEPARRAFAIPDRSPPHRTGR